MSPQTIRRIDYWIGRPLCRFMTLARRIASILPGRSRQNDCAQPPRRILFVKLIEQGATVLAYRALEKATQIAGRDNVFVLVFRRNRAILDLLNVIPSENVIAIRDESPLSMVVDTVRALIRIRRLGVDAAIDMEFFARASALITFLTGAKRRVGLHRFTSEGPYRGDLFTHRIPHNPHLHVAPAYFGLVEALSQDPRQTPMLKSPVPSLNWQPPAFKPLPVEVQTVRNLLPPDAGVLVLLNPNASDLLPLRRWPTERFIELGRRILADDPAVTIVITGGPDEQAAGEAVARQIDPERAVCVAGKTTLRQLLVLYTIADVMVTNDSGPGHFASLSKMETVVLFGPETPELFGPVGANIRVLRANLGCSPCVSALNHRFSACTDNVCMREISVDQVLSEVADALNQRRRPTLRLTLLRDVFGTPAAKATAQ